MVAMVCPKDGHAIVPAFRGVTPLPWCWGEAVGLVVSVTQPWAWCSSRRSQ